MKAGLCRGCLSRLNAHIESSGRYSGGIAIHCAHNGHARLVILSEGLIALQRDQPARNERSAARAFRTLMDRIASSVGRTVKVTTIFRKGALHND